MPTLTFEQARQCVLDQVTLSSASRPHERVPLSAACGRVLAEDIVADRDYPPFDRSARDGYAVRAADLPGTLRVVGEVPAGSVTAREVLAGEAIEIMTGAPLPPGADAVLMVEHVEAAGDMITTSRGIESGENFNHRGSECRQGAIVVPRNTRIDYAGVAMLATAGYGSVTVHSRPRVAILATGDELTDVEAQPAPWQIRNSNAHALAAQVSEAGGIPILLPIAHDNPESSLPLIEQGLDSDLLLMSGGVSAGKYDIVERMLARLGAEFFFDRVLIQPGQPLVFGRARGTFFFGLPGNPASTMVTFEVFARAALERLAGIAAPQLPVALARLTTAFRQRPGLTRFLPARLGPALSEVTPVHWAGSGDVAALCRANAFLVTDPDRDTWQPGDLIGVLPKR